MSTLFRLRRRSHTLHQWLKQDLRGVINHIAVDRGPQSVRLQVVSDPCLQRLCDDTLFDEHGVLASIAPPTPKPVQNVCQSDASLAPVATTVLLPATRAGVFPRFVNIAGEDA
jgi:hypothetical protein